MTDASRPREPDLRSFFEQLDAGEGDNAALFHEQFFSLDPHRVALVTREQLRAVLPARAEMFRSIGATGTRLRELSSHWLDDQHVVAETTWDVIFRDDAAEPLTLRSTYLLRWVDGALQVLVYLNHQDIAAVVAARRTTR